MAKLASSCTHKLFYEGKGGSSYCTKWTQGLRVPRRGALHRREQQHRLLAPPGSRSGGADRVFFVSTGGGLIGRLICARFCQHSRLFQRGTTSTLAQRQPGAHTHTHNAASPARPNGVIIPAAEAASANRRPPRRVVARSGSPSARRPRSPVRRA